MRVCVYCGSSVGAHAEYARAAHALGQSLARRGIGLVYGGGKVGLMGVLADAALAAGGEVQGVIPEHLQAKEVGHAGLTRLHVVRSMHERKAMMADLSDVFLALPGGLGTLEELAEVATWTQLGLQAKPVGLWNVQGYFSPLIHFLDHMVQECFLRREHRSLLVVGEELESLLDALLQWKAPRVEKWIDRADR